ncbi:hypothetical protein OE88DRAFT_1803317 [Heliocybe sulcata]|uniref:F-box domain-containing protein n=1 Tax=Heliocybe sulcata TaxID=5364 RepID=A0A5C3NSE5_9AGAM|nr:hypothetical protein OE88DRAFT_1803317 [Heliocybe sulcata]
MYSQYAFSNAVGDPSILPKTAAPYKLPSVKNPPPLPSIPDPGSSSREPGSRWKDPRILIYRLMTEEEPTRAYNEAEVRAMRERAQEYKHRLHLMDTIPDHDHWRREDAYESFSFARYLMLWKIFPINELPSEILTHIFRYVALSMEISFDALHSRSYLTWVCRHWRATAIGDPILWSSIHFKLKKDDTLIPPSRSMQKSLAFLERASNVILDIRISASPLDWGMPMHAHESGLVDPKLVRRVVQLIAPKVRQLRTLKIDLENPVCDYALKLLYDAMKDGTTLKHLRSVELRRVRTKTNANPPKSEHELPVPFLGSRLPALRNLALDALSVNWADSTFSSNITALDLSTTHCKDLPMFDTELTRILNACSNIEVLRIGSGYHNLHIAGHVVEPVRLDKLHILTLSKSSVVNCVAIVSLFHAPHVKCLVASYLQTRDCTPLYAALTGRFPEVQCLTLEGMGHPDSDASAHVLAGMFSTMPQLTYLKVRDFSFEERIYEGMLSDLSVGVSSALISLDRNGVEFDRRLWQAGEHLCPKLEILECHNYDSLGYVLEFSVARKEQGLPLKKFYATEVFLRDMAREEVEEFQDVTEVWLLPKGICTDELYAWYAETHVDVSVAWL